MPPGAASPAAASLGAAQQQLQLNLTARSFTLSPGTLFSTCMSPRTRIRCCSMPHLFEGGILPRGLRGKRMMLLFRPRAVIHFLNLRLRRPKALPSWLKRELDVGERSTRSQGPSNTLCSTLHPIRTAKLACLARLRVSLIAEAHLSETAPSPPRGAN